MVGPSPSSMTPDLMASSRVRYSLTDTLSLAARSVKKKSMSMAATPDAGVPSRIHAKTGGGCCPRGDNARMPALSATEIAFLMVAFQQAVLALGWTTGAQLL